LNRRCALTLVLVLAGACASADIPSESALAALPPLPYRISINGGAFLPESDRKMPAEPPVTGHRLIAAKTYPEGVAEPIELERIISVLRRTRLATAVVVPAGVSAADREKLALNPTGDGFETARRQAEAAGADLMLVIEGMRDAPVVEHGRTDQWPISTAAWLIIGLGMFVPDHRYESTAELVASVWDVHSGARLRRIPISPKTVDLALVDRSDFWGIVLSIIVPPTLLWNDDDNVVHEVRAVTDRSLLLGLVERLKSREVMQDLSKGLHLTARPDGGVLVRVETQQELRSVEVEIDGARWSGTDKFAASLLATQRKQPSNRNEYRWVIPPVDGRELRVIVETLAGQVISSTVGLKEQ